MAKKGTQVTRRGLLQIGGRSLFAGALATLCRPFAFASPAAMRLQDVTADTFEPYLGRFIEFKAPASASGVSTHKVALRLASVDRHDHLSLIESQKAATRGKRTREPFSLLFESHGTPLSAGLQTIAHKDFASCELLLSRVCRPKADGTIYYEAVFGYVRHRVRIGWLLATQPAHNHRRAHQAPFLHGSPETMGFVQQTWSEDKTAT